MCEFCTRHGEGERWYLQAKNYAEDLLSDLSRHRMLAEFLDNPNTALSAFRRLDLLDKVPRFIGSPIRSYITARFKREHFGQVVPIEDIERILGLVNSIVRLPCICRHMLAGKSDARYCYGVAMGPNGGKVADLFNGLDASFVNGPDTSGLEELDAETATAALREYEKRGLCHTIWTFGTPFIGGICNCDRADCLAMQATVARNVQIMFRAEYVAQVDPDLCSGCRACMKVCQFGAIGFSVANEQACIDPRACYGCGVCRAVCPEGAITLVERKRLPAVADLW
jgi:ferredoxin